MKILLVHPPGNYMKLISGYERKPAVIPMGLMYIAAELERCGHEVQILDALIDGYYHEEPVRGDGIRYGLPYKEIVRRISDYGPDIVGVTCLQSARHHEAHEVLRAAKEYDPRVTTVMGGPHATGIPRLNMKDPNLDIIVLREGEKVFARLVEELSKANPDLSSVPSICRRDGDEIRTNQGVLVYEDIDDLPWPAYHMVPMEKYFEVGENPSPFHGIKRTSIMITSRGCPHCCSYCPSGMTFVGSRRKRSMTDVLDEMAFLNYEYGVEEIQFEDYNFTVDREMTAGFCRELIRRNLPMTWGLPHGMEVHSLDDELLEMLWESGNHTLYLAVESANADFFGSDGMKDVERSEVYRVIKRGRELGFRIVLYFMIGHYSETKDDILRTVALARELSPDYVNFFITTPVPGTRYFDECMAKGLFYEGFNIERDVWRLRYSKGNIATDEFDPEFVERTRKEAFDSIVHGDKYVAYKAGRTEKRTPAQV